MSLETPQSNYFIETPGLPLILKSQYNQKKLPFCLSRASEGKYFREGSCGKFDLYLIKHTDTPIILSPQHTLKKDDHYLDLTLHRCDSLDEAISSLKELAEFVKKFDGIKWLVGASWLGSVANGKLIERYGFHPTNIQIPNITNKNSKEIGLSKKNQTPQYTKLVKKSNVKFIYAPREEFLSHFSV